MTTATDTFPGNVHLTHRFTHDTDRCICGGEWVYFDDEGTHGCEVAGPFMAGARNMDVDDAGIAAGARLPLDHVGNARCEACGAQEGRHGSGPGTVYLAACAGLGVLCETCSFECPCPECEAR